MHFVNHFAQDIWNKKYGGEFKGRPLNYYRNLAKIMSLSNPEREAAFVEMLLPGRFSPGGRILAFAGRTKSSVSLMNCTTHQIEDDSLDAISKAALTIMKASSHGQGIGVNLSNLRPKEAKVNNSAKTSTGAISFMEMLNTVGMTIGQEGRRAAILFALRISHPDVWRKGAKDVECPKCHGAGCQNCNGGKIPYDFLHVKTMPGHVESANISLLVSDAFMEAVETDSQWTMSFDGESGGESFHVESQVPARELFMELARTAHNAGEPGVLFEDTIRRASNSDMLGERWKVVGTNACSEMMLDQDGVCNLGSLNLAKYVQNPFTPQAHFDQDLFVQDIQNAIEFLDNVLTMELEDNRSISQAQRESVEQLRRVGAGVMGFADTLVMMGLRYKYEQATIDFIKSTFGLLRDTAYKASIKLALNKEPCGAWDKATYEERLKIVSGGFYRTLPETIKSHLVAYGLRNATLLSIAPTGTISNLLGVSSGIEPLFAREYVRRVRMQGGDDQFITYVHPGVQASRDLGLPDEIWDTAYSVEPEDHVLIQAMIQEYIDSSIAKTTNLPKDATVDDVAAIYMLAWKLGIKGITVYRDTSRDMQVLYQTGGPEERCPNCGSPLVRQEGCVKCPSCGYGKCDEK